MGPSKDNNDKKPATKKGDHVKVRTSTRRSTDDIEVSNQALPSNYYSYYHIFYFRSI